MATKKLKKHPYGLSPSQRKNLTRGAVLATAQEVCGSRNVELHEGYRTWGIRFVNCSPDYARHAAERLLAELCMVRDEMGGIINHPKAGYREDAGFCALWID